MEVVNQISWLQIAAIVIPNILLFGGFVIWVRVQMAIMKLEIETIKEALKSSAQEDDDSAKDLKKQIGILSSSFTQMKDDFGSKLYDMNTKVTESSTIIKIKLKEQ